MNIKEQLRKKRNESNMTQDQIADMIYVSRQTISNWENGKSYPDIKSLILLCDIYKISLDELVRGDIESMKKQISKDEWIRDSKMMFYFGASFIGAFVFLSRTSGLIKGIVLTVTFISAVLMLYFSFKLEIMKKNKDLKTYNEILAFLNEDEN